MPDPVSLAVKFNTVPGAIHTRPSTVPRVALNECRAAGGAVSMRTSAAGAYGPHAPHESMVRTRQYEFPSEIGGDRQYAFVERTSPLSASIVEKSDRALT